MEKFVSLAFLPDATDSTVLGNADGKLPTSPLALSLDDPATNLYFSTVLSPSSKCIAHGAWVGLLALPARQIQEISQSKFVVEKQPQFSTFVENSQIDIFKLYLSAVAMRMESLIYSWNSFFLDDINSTSSISTIRLIVEIIKAVASAAHLCQRNRSVITTSGILLSLKTLITSTVTEKPRIESLNPSPLVTKRCVTSSVPADRLFTPFHAEFLQCCISAGQYRFAQEFVTEYSIQAVSPCLSLLYTKTSDDSDTSIIPTEMFLRYHYYIGIIHLASDSYNNAKTALEMCLTIPGERVSLISVAARKKLILIECLRLCEEEDFHQGHLNFKDARFHLLGSKSEQETDVNKSSPLVRHLLALPYGTSSIFTKLVDRVSNQNASANTKTTQVPTSLTPDIDDFDDINSNPEDSLSRSSSKSSVNQEFSVGSPSNYFGLLAYDDIAHAFACGNVTLLKSRIQCYLTLLGGDGNMGLVNRLVPALQYLLFIRASHVYQVIPMISLVQFLQLEVQDMNLVQTVEYWLMTLSLHKKDFIRFRSDHEKGLVTFFGRTGTFTDEVTSSQWITHHIDTCMKLAERISKLDIAITTSVKYQHALLKEEVAMKQATEESTKSVRDLIP